MNIRSGLELITEGIYGFIYITTNMANGKRYIGQKIVDKNGIWKEYLGSGLLIKKAISKYGKENFYKDIVDIAYDANELDNKEKEWIAKYNAAGVNDFYNLTKGGRSFVGFYNINDPVQTEIVNRKRTATVNAMHKIKENHARCTLKSSEVKDIAERLHNGEFVKDLAEEYNVSIATIEDVHRTDKWSDIVGDLDFTNRVTQIRRRISKPVLQYDLYGNFVGRYECVQDAIRDQQLQNNGSIYSCLTKKVNMACGYMWFYEDDPTIEETINNADLLKKLRDYFTPARLKTNYGHKSKTRKPVLQFDKDNNFICKYESLSAASKALNLDIKNISNVCNGKIGCKTAGGYIWKFENECGDLKYGTA